MRPFALFALSALSVVSAAPSFLSGALMVQEGDTHTMNSWQFINCGDPSDLIEIKSLTISPDPPQPGQNLTVKVHAYVKETIEDGAYADVVVKLGLIKLLQKTFDVCEEAENNNAEIRCPVEAGEHFVEQTVALPKEIPKAKFVVSVRAFSVTDEDLMCADIKLDFLPKRPF